jgi:hypothetical protein
MSGPNSSTARSFVWLLFVVMFFAHQDFWWWDDESMILGFLPIGLAFHALFSIGCALLGWLAITKAWPKELEAFADEKEDLDLADD